MGELEDAQAKIKELQPLADRVPALSQQVVDLSAARDTATGDVAGVRNELAKSKAESEGYKVQLETATTTIATHEDVVTKLTEMTANRDSIVTRHQESIINRLKGLGVPEETYKDKPLEQIEAMELALGSVKLQAPDGGNSTGNENKAGLTGGSGSNGSVTASGLDSEEAMYQAAKTRERSD